MRVSGLERISGRFVVVTVPHGLEAGGKFFAVGSHAGINSFGGLGLVLGFGIVRVTIKLLGSD